jgi:hypothetical protein
MSEVRDLDLFIPEHRTVRLAGQDIDVSFLPTGLTFAVSDVLSEIATIDAERLSGNDPDETRKAFDLGVKLCATFCSYRHPEMTDQWFRENTTAAQIGALGAEIRNALERAYTGIDSKN